MSTPRTNPNPSWATDLPFSLIARIEAIAKSERRARNQMMHHLIEEALEARGGKLAPKRTTSSPPGGMFSTSVSLPPSVKVRVLELAAGENRARAEMVRILLEDAVDVREARLVREREPRPSNRRKRSA